MRYTITRATSFQRPERAVHQQHKLKRTAEALLLTALAPQNRALPAGVLAEQNAHGKRREAAGCARDGKMVRLHGGRHGAECAPRGEGLRGEHLVEQLLHFAEKAHQAAEILVAVPCGALKAAAEHPVVVAVDADLRRVVMGSKGFLFHVILLCTEKCRQSGRKGSCAIGSSPQTVTV